MSWGQFQKAPSTYKQDQQEDAANQNKNAQSIFQTNSDIKNRDILTDDAWDNRIPGRKRKISRIYINASLDCNKNSKRFQPTWKLHWITKVKK